MVLWTTFFFLQFQANFLVGEKNLPGSGSGSGSRFLAGSGYGFNEYGSETLAKTIKYLPGYGSFRCTSVKVRFGEKNRVRIRNYIADYLNAAATKNIDSDDSLHLLGTFSQQDQRTRGHCKHRVDSRELCNQSIKLSQKYIIQTDLFLLIR